MHSRPVAPPRADGRLSRQQHVPAGATWFDGEAQRANLAIAIALKPKILLLDEPTSACDSETTALVEVTLRKFTGALLLVTHDAEQAARLCDHHLCLAKTASSASLAELV